MIPKDIIDDANNFFPNRDKNTQFLLRKGYIAGRLIERRKALMVFDSLSEEQYNKAICLFDTNLFDADLNDEK